MRQKQEIFFGPFRFNRQEQRLWKANGEIVKLEGRPLALLCCLAAHPRLPIDEHALTAGIKSLLRANYIGELKKIFYDLRKILGEDAKKPQFLEVTRGKPTQYTLLADHVFVGRKKELDKLQEVLAKAFRGQRQLVFVAGGPGIGKTTLIEQFLDDAVRNPQIWIGEGQCLFPDGGGPFRPVIDAVQRICVEEFGKKEKPFQNLLKLHARNWLREISSIFTDEEQHQLSQSLSVQTGEQPLPSMVQLVERLPPNRALILYIEDLHWSDPSTIQLLDALARRPEQARLLILASYRPVEAIVNNPPLMTTIRELRAQCLCEELQLEVLSKQEVKEYLVRRLASPILPAKLTNAIYEQTDGNPLFVVSTLEQLLQQGKVVSRDGNWELPENTINVPESLHQLIENQRDHLTPEERQILDGASIAGRRFSVATVAVGVNVPEKEVERCCEELVRKRLFIRPCGVEEGGDGTITTRYEFLHALHREVLSTRIAEGRASQIHRRIGDQKEVRVKGQTAEIAGELAIHFERAREYARAVQYRHQASETALRRSAFREAAEDATRARELLLQLPDTPERAQQTLLLLMSLGPALAATKGFGTPEVKAVYDKIATLLQQSESAPQLFDFLQAQWGSHLMQGEMTMARKFASQIELMAKNKGDVGSLRLASTASGATAFFLGDFNQSRTMLELPLTDDNHSSQQLFELFSLQLDTVTRRACLSWTLWALGYPDQARATIKEGLLLALAIEPRAVFGIALAHFFLTCVYQFCGQVEEALEEAKVTIALADECGFESWAVIGTLWKGWAEVKLEQGNEGFTLMHQSMDRLSEMGGEKGLNLPQSYLLALMAEACRKAGRVDEGLAHVAEAVEIVQKTGVRWNEAELYRLQGELILKRTGRRAKSLGKT